MYIQALRFALLATIALCCGCTTYAQRARQVRDAYDANQIEVAATAAAEALKRDRANADLLKLDRAMIELAAGDAKAAERTLREVRDRFEELEGAGAGAAGSALSFLTDDNRRIYPGEDYEKVLIRAFLALSNLMHDGGDAEAYSLQLIDKQDQIIQAGADKRGENPKLNYQRVALAPYLRGVLREATHLDYDDAERSYTAVVSWQPSFQAGRFDLDRSAHGQHSSPGNGVLYVFALTGRGPYKEEAVEVPSSVSLFIAGEIVSAVGNQTVPPNVAPVKVPRLVARQSVVQAIGVAAGSQRLGLTETITDVTQLSIQQYDVIYPRIVARAVARRCLKKGLVYGGKEMSGIAKGSLAGLAVDVAGIAWEATETADTRSWGLLPDKIQVLRVELPEGEHDIALQPLSASGRAIAGAARQRVAISNGRNTYLLASFPESQLVGNVLVSQP
jgi:hypothetical protein